MLRFRIKQKKLDANMLETAEESDNPYSWIDQGETRIRLRIFFVQLEV